MKGTMLLVFDVNKERLIFKKEIGGGKVRNILFRKNNEIVTIGEGHIHFWEIKDNQLYETKGMFGRYNSDLLCI